MRIRCYGGPNDSVIVNVVDPPPPYLEFAVKFQHPVSFRPPTQRDLEWELQNSFIPKVRYKLQRFCLVPGDPIICRYIYEP